MRFDPERDKWSIDATQRLLPEIAEKVFKTKPRDIVYAWHSDIDRLDTEYGTDAILKAQKRNVALAIRIRGVYYYQEFGDITIRYDSLQTLGKMLEIQKSIARFMFYGWGNTNSPGLPQKVIREKRINPNTIAPPSYLVDWHVIFLQRLIDLYLKKRLDYSGPFFNKDTSSRLIGIKISELKKLKLIYRSMNNCSENLITDSQKVEYIQANIFDENDPSWEAYLNELHHAPYIYD